MFKPEIEDIKMEIKCFLDKEPYSESTVYKKHYAIMELLVTEDAPNVDLNYIIEIATHDTPNILIILKMLKEKGKLSINSVSEENQRKLLLILLTMNESDYYIFHFQYQNYFKLLEFIISTFNIDLNEFEGFDTILHIMVKDYFTTLKDLKTKKKKTRDSSLLYLNIYNRKKKVFVEKIKFLIKHGAYINKKNKDDKTIFDLFEDIPHSTPSYKSKPQEFYLKFAYNTKKELETDME